MAEDCRECALWERCPCGKAGHENGTSVGYSIGECKMYDPIEIARQYAPKFDKPVVDMVEVVRCKDCKHRIVNEHYGEKGYLKLKAMCDLDTGDQFELGRNAEDDDWFCADAERKESGE